MPRVKNIAGQRFGKLVAEKMIGLRDGQGAIWSSRCDCGGVRICLAASLQCGKTRSCGCLVKEGLRKRSITHGLSGTPTYRIWAGMIVRCSNPKDRAWRFYGGRGVTVCKKWRTSFASFLKDMGPRPAGLTIERINPAGNYEPGNCKWATWKEQHRNTRQTRRITIDGTTRCVAEWSEITGVHRDRIYSRLKRGLTGAEAVS